MQYAPSNAIQFEPDNNIQCESKRDMSVRRTRVKMQRNLNSDKSTTHATGSTSDVAMHDFFQRTIFIISIKFDLFQLQKKKKMITNTYTKARHKLPPLGPGFIHNDIQSADNNGEISTFAGARERSLNLNKLEGDATS